MKTTYQTGLAGELQAEEWLIRNRGMKTLERRYRTKAGEIDLIMAEGNTVVFVEVKTRIRAAAACSPLTPPSSGAFRMPPSCT